MKQKFQTRAEADAAYLKHTGEEFNKMEKEREFKKAVEAGEITPGGKKIIKYGQIASTSSRN